jgi:glutamine synthetase
MGKIKLEYIWLDGNEKQPQLRSKTKIINHTSKQISLDNIPDWGFDGSSTMQAEGNYSDCVLKPVNMIKDPQRRNAYLVMCEVLNPDGSAHETNTRAQIDEYKEGKLWFGFEQEYFLFDPKTNKPSGFPKDGEPKEQGDYYCGVGNRNVALRNVVENHLDLCIEAGLNITGINAEVALGQWEYQLFSDKGEKDAGDLLWLSRYLLHRVCEKYGIAVELHPKPISGDWNGSGMHTNFSTEKMREDQISETIYDVLEERASLHIDNYGSDNDQRLTGDYETQSIDKFSYGVSDRGASIRIPQQTNKDGKGYLEDRRPASNADPYKVVKVLSEALKIAEADLVTLEVRL